jgi:hypothetical protein
MINFSALFKSTNRLSLCLILAALVLPVASTMAAPRNAKIKDKDKKDKALDSAADLAPDAKKAPPTWSPEIALLGTVALPVGEAGKILDMGFGGKADITTHIPALTFLKQKSFDLRPGFFGGYQMYPVKSAAGGNFTAMPFVLYAEVDFTTVSTAFVPYFALGAGVNMASASATGVSSVDAALHGALGAKIYPGKERRFFIKAEAAFFTVFETVTGMFIQGNIGIGYKL